MKNPNRLSGKSVLVLKLIAEGLSYAQIIEAHPQISYFDIFGAAAEALRLNEGHLDYQESLSEVRSRHPRAYERWTSTEDAELATMQSQGKTISQMATRLQRQSSAIRSRLVRLGLTPIDPSEEN